MTIAGAAAGSASAAVAADVGDGGHRVPAISAFSRIDAIDPAQYIPVRKVTQVPSNPVNSRGEDMKSLLRIMLVLGVIFLFYRMGTDTSSSPPVRIDSSISRPSTLTDVRNGIISGSPAEVVRVTATELFREHDNNEVATDNRLKGKIVEVTGRVESINKNFLDDVYISLVTQINSCPRACMS
nr:OB-fold putative lipoprotein [Bradyrhizobium sp. 157]